MDAPKNKLCHEVRNAILEVYASNKEILRATFKQYTALRRIEKALEEFSKSSEVNHDINT